MKEKLSVIEVSPPEIVYSKNTDGSQGCKLVYKVNKTGQQNYSLLDELVPLNHIEIEFLSIVDELPDFSECPTSVLMGPVLSFLGPLVFFWPIELRIGEIDEDTYNSLNEFRKSISDVYCLDIRKLSCGRINTNKKVKNKRVHDSKKKLVMYSGGIDSYSNIAHNYKTMILGSVEGLEATRGRDRTVTEPAMLVKRQEMKRLAIKFNTQAVVLRFFPYLFIDRKITTDRMKELGIMSSNYGFDFVSDTILHTPIISMFAPYAYLTGSDISIGSTFQPINDYQLKHGYSIQRDCGSSFFSDTLIFCGQKFCKQDGLRQMRTDKLSDIIKFNEEEKASVKLIVCFSDSAENCGKCKKCIRTQLNLLVLNQDPRKWDFPNFSPKKIIGTIEAQGLSAHDIFDIRYHIKPNAKYKLMDKFLHDFERTHHQNTKEPLVSVITPCHNGEKYIRMLLTSVLAQTYTNVEMIVVDDGSTDNTKEIIIPYIEKFAEKNYKLSYVYQKNMGQSYAINKALKFVNGTYLVWPDADDHYAESTAVQEMVRVLGRSDKKVSMVRVQYNVIDEAGSIIQRFGVNDETQYKTDLFEDAILGTNGFWYPPGGYMAKVSNLDASIPNREIYVEKGAGQNFQLYLPLLYQQKCLTIQKYLYNILAHEDSHSRNIATNKNRQQIYYRTIKKTLIKIPMIKSYRSYLMKRVAGLNEVNASDAEVKRRYRTTVKRAIKSISPYGLIVLYRRKG